MGSLQISPKEALLTYFMISRTKCEEMCPNKGPTMSAKWKVPKDEEHGPLTAVKSYPTALNKPCGFEQNPDIPSPSVGVLVPGMSLNQRIEGRNDESHVWMVLYL